MNSRIQSHVDTAAVIYLVLPLALFFGVSLKPIPAILFVVLLIAGAAPLIVSTWRSRDRAVMTSRALMAIAIVAVVWAIVSGAGGVLFQNPDWEKHNGVLTDLSRYSWPVTYGTTEDGRDIILRYYMGFHVVPAFIAKLFGNLNLWEAIWQASGVFLVLTMILRRFRADRRWLVGLVFVFFGGLDIVGYIWLHGVGQLTPNQNIDGWDLVQMNSNATLLAWVPNHALAAWLGLLLIKDYGRDKRFLLGAPILLAAVAFWSVFVAIGLLPFALAPIVRQLWATGFRYVVHFSVVTGFLAAVVMCAFLVSGAGDGNIHGILWQVFPNTGVVWYALASLCCHVLPFLIVFFIAKFRFDTWTIIAFLVLALLPFYVFGVSLDLTMRASIPAQLVLFLGAATLLCGNTSTKIEDEQRAEKSFSKLRVIPLGLILILGSGAAITTFVRAFHPIRTPSVYDSASASQLLSVVGGKFAPPDTQYLAPMPHLLDAAFREYSPVFAYTTIVNSNTSWHQVGGDAHAAVNHDSDGITFVTSGGGAATISTDKLLGPGIYRIRLTMSQFDKPLAQAVGIGLGDHQVALPETSIPRQWAADDFVSIVNAPTPLSISITTTEPAGAAVRFDTIDIQSVTRKHS